MTTKLSDIIESVLFVAGNAVDLSEIKSKLAATNDEIDNAVNILKERFNKDNGINLLIFNNKLQFSTNPNFIENVSLVLNPIREKELTKSMLETLAIIAYKQPITKTEMEELRGVDSNYAVQMLIKLNLIYVSGRKEAIGKPLLFCTTDEFLKHFSLSSLNELPSYDALLDRIKTMNDIDNQSNLFDLMDRTNDLIEQNNTNIETKQDANTNIEIKKDTTINKSFGQGDNVKKVEKKTTIKEMKKEKDNIINYPIKKTNDEQKLTINEEELPEFLKGEDIEIITSD